MRLTKFLRERGVEPRMEEDFADVRFVLDGEEYIGEIKVTTYLSPAQAFRSALGQLLEYANLNRERPARMVMFLDSKLDGQRVDLANKLGITLITESDGKYVVLNPAFVPAKMRALLD